MKTGALIFAQNNSSIDYVKLAVFAAKRVKQFLGIPVSIITDSPDWLNSQYPDHPFEFVINQAAESGGNKLFYDGAMASKLLEWKNVSRPKIFDLSPYDRTLVIDSDYIISSDILKPALDKTDDLQLYRHSMDLSTWRQGLEFKRVNDQSVPFYWATTFVFTKNSTTRAFFDLVAFIKDNWQYYKVLYSIDSTVYRNDYAFSIAIHIMNGNTDGTFATDLPGKMVYCLDKDVLLEINEAKLKFLVEKKDHLGEYIAAATSNLDVHVMNKVSLSRCIDGESYE